MIVKLLWFTFLILFDVIVAPVSTISRWCKEVLFGTPIFSDNGLPLLTENIFQTLPPFIWSPRLLIFRLSVGSPLLKTPPLLFGTGEYYQPINRTMYLFFFIYQSSLSDLPDVSIYISISLFVYLSTYLSIYLSICLCTCPYSYLGYALLVITSQNGASWSMGSLLRN